MNLAERTSTLPQPGLHGSMSMSWGCQYDKQTNLDRQHPHLPHTLTCVSTPTPFGIDQGKRTHELIELSFYHPVIFLLHKIKYLAIGTIKTGHSFGTPDLQTHFVISKNPKAGPISLPQTDPHTTLE